MAANKKYILQANAIEKKIARLALEIIEDNIAEKELIFVGIESSGVILAKAIKAFLKEHSNINIQLLTLKLNKQKPDVISIGSDMNFDDKVIILIDDVTNSGKTLLYAMKPFLAYHPKKIQTLVLVERSHTQFPISADYKGYSLATTLQEHILVEVKDDKITGAYLA